MVRSARGASCPISAPRFSPPSHPTNMKCNSWRFLPEDIDFESNASVIAISGQIMQFDRCVDISREFRARGRKTIVGGYLPSMLPDRVEGLFDAIVIGEGDDVWPQILSDIERGKLKSRYRPAEPPDISKLPVPRYDLIRKDRVVVYPVQATRGCPFTCQYC